MTLILEREVPNLATLRNQIINLNESSRRFTGTGIFVDFDLTEKNLCQDCLSVMTLGQSVIAKVGIEKLLIGFVLYIEDGVIVTLEIFAYEGLWRGEGIENAEFL